jgi:formate hydrogenlyase transcriptional activator
MRKPTVKQIPDHVASKVKAQPPICDGPSSPEKQAGPTKTQEFELLISEILVRFVKISAEQIDSEIRASIRRIIEFLGLDRGALAQWSADGTHMVCTHRWTVPGVSPVVVSPGSSAAPWVCRQILRGKEVTFSQVEDLPEEAAEDKEFFSGAGTKSHMSLPLEIDGNVIGAMTLESIRTGKIRPDEVALGLKPVADVFAGAVERKRRKLELTDRLRFETLLSDLSARFVKIPPGEIGREIKQALQDVAELFHGDYSGLIEVLADQRLARVTHAWYAEGIEPVPENVNLAAVFPWSYGNTIEQGRHIMFRRPADLPYEAVKDRQSWEAMGTKSALVIPILLEDSFHYLIAIHSSREERTWQEEYVPRLRLLGETLVNALIRKGAEEKLRRSCEEIRALKDRLQVEAEYLRSEIKHSQPYEEIIGQSDALSKVLALVEQVAPTDSTVLICGETGTGKELIAQAIHNLSPYRDKLMVKVNCASLPAALVESELFGREKGAYTGALTRQIGRFELADGSTIFLDEIAEMSLELQAKLLRVLQEGQFERLGSPKTIRVHVRVIAATNRNLDEEVKKGNFREDLYYRLNVFPVVVPPLRERLDDLPMLAWAFVGEFGEKMGKKIHKIAKGDMEALQRYSWPGNIRELRNVIEYAVIVSTGDTLQVRLPVSARKEISNVMTLEEIEYQHIMDVLRHAGGRIKGEGGAARILGMNPSTLYSKMQKLGISLRGEKGEISS